MAKLFDKISADFMAAIKGVVESTAAFEKARDEEKKARMSGEDKDKVAKLAAMMSKEKKLRKEEAEQIDELSTEKLLQYTKKASDAQGHRKLPLKKVDNRYAGVHMASKKLDKRFAKEEAEQIDELSKGTLGRYINKATSQVGEKGITAGLKVQNNEPAGKEFKTMGKRQKGIAKATDKLTKEEIEMIEAKLAGVAPGSMEGDKHMCATKVFHKEWKEGTPIKTMHADPDADGLIEWYDVMFDHGIERVMTEDMEILQQESHMHSKRGLKKEEVELEEGENKTGLPKSTAEKNKQYIEVTHTSGNKKRVPVHPTNAYKALNRYRNDPTTKSARIVSESEELDEARGRPKKAAAKDFTVHPKTGEKLMHNNPEHMKKIEALQKTGALQKPKTEAGQHIINQLRKASTSMTGGATVHFTHGESKHVTSAHAGKALDKYAGMKPHEKEDFQKKISHSHEEMMKHI